MATIMILSVVYALYGDVGFVTAIFFGLKAAVLAIVLQAVARIGQRVLKSPVKIAIAAASFTAIFFFDAPFPAIIVAAGLFGYGAGRAGLKAFAASDGHDRIGGHHVVDADTILGQDVPVHARPDMAWSLKIGLVLLTLWLAPTIALILVLGLDHVFTDIAIFFSQMAVVTFGGAYAVLAYVAQAAVDSYGWLEPGEMLDGLGMAETTPGPLIMVTQFVGFMGAFRDPGALPPLLAGIQGGLLATWVTFAPCFLWIFLGAPHVEKLRGNRALSAGLAAITAAVVGVVLNLAIWFAVHVVFREVTIFEGWGLRVSVPNLETLDPAAVLLSAAALLAVFRFKINVIVLLALSAVVGMVLFAAGIEVR
jgi:chromate transporter